MKPTDILMREHRAITTVLDSMESVARLLDAESRFETQAAEEVLVFLREFADGCHRRKEEEFLYPAMEACRIFHPNGQVALLRREHEESRALLDVLDATLEDAAAGEPLALRQFARYSYAYVGLHREHICREDYSLFRIADETLCKHDQQELLDVFEKIESEQRNNGNQEKYLRMAESLATQFAACGEESDPELWALAVAER